MPVAWLAPPIDLVRPQVVFHDMIEAGEVCAAEVSVEAEPIEVVPVLIAATPLGGVAMVHLAPSSL